MKQLKYIIIFVIFFLSTKEIFAQACCTAGTPLLSTLDELLYYTNLIPYDRATGSSWSQMKLQIIIDKFREKKFLIYGNSNTNFITAFDISEISDTVEFISTTSDLPWIFNDNIGNQYDLFGSSENKSVQLNPAKSFISYWFAWAAFYQNTRLYKK